MTVVPVDHWRMEFFHGENNTEEYEKLVMKCSRPVVENGGGFMDLIYIIFIQKE